MHRQLCLKVGSSCALAYPPCLPCGLLKPWHDSEFHRVAEDIEELVPEDEDDTSQVYEVEKILRWRWMGHGRRKKEYLVLWSGYSLDDATWELASHFLSATGLPDLVCHDNPPEAVHV